MSNHFNVSLLRGTPTVVNVTAYVDANFDFCNRESYRFYNGTEAYREWR